MFRSKSFGSHPKPHCCKAARFLRWRTNLDNQTAHTDWLGGKLSHVQSSSKSDLTESYISIRRCSSTHLRGFAHLHLHVKSHWGCVTGLCNLCSVLNATHQQSSSQNMSQDSPLHVSQTIDSLYMLGGVTEQQNMFRISMNDPGALNMSHSLRCRAIFYKQYHGMQWGYMTHMIWYSSCVFIALSRNILWINTMSDKFNYGVSGVFLLPWIRI